MRTRQPSSSLKCMRARFIFTYIYMLNGIAGVRRWAGVENKRFGLIISTMSGKLMAQRAACAFNLIFPREFLTRRKKTY